MQESEENRKNRIRLYVKEEVERREAILKSPLNMSQKDALGVFFSRSLHMYPENNETNDETICGCYFCCQVFPKFDIVEWVDRGATAICPMCDIDSVLFDYPERPITYTFLRKMKSIMFASFT